MLYSSQKIMIIHPLAHFHISEKLGEWAWEGGHNYYDIIIIYSGTPL
jgi:hypothetical protein